MFFFKPKQAEECNLRVVTAQVNNTAKLGYLLNGLKKWRGSLQTQTVRLTLSPTTAIQAVKLVFLPSNTTPCHWIIMLFEVSKRFAIAHPSNVTSQIVIKEILLILFTTTWNCIPSDTFFQLFLLLLLLIFIIINNNIISIITVIPIHNYYCYAILFLLFPKTNFVLFCSAFLSLPITHPLSLFYIAITFLKIVPVPKG